MKMKMEMQCHLKQQKLSMLMDLTLGLELYIELGQGLFELLGMHLNQ
jgi:hypothetical protein